VAVLFWGSGCQWNVLRQIRIGLLLPDNTGKASLKVCYFIIYLPLLIVGKFHKEQLVIDSETIDERQ
jgi:hypothetical protein